MDAEAPREAAVASSIVIVGVDADTEFDADLTIEQVAFLRGLFERINENAAPVEGPMIFFSEDLPW